MDCQKPYLIQGTIKEMRKKICSCVSPPCLCTSISKAFKMISRFNLIQTAQFKKAAYFKVESKNCKTTSDQVSSNFQQVELKLQCFSNVSIYTNQSLWKKLQIFILRSSSQGKKNRVCFHKSSFNSTLSIQKTVICRYF